MSRFRAGVLLGTGIVGGVALVVANCADPTQITLEIRAEPGVCASLKTGIAVTSLGKINDDPLAKLTQGCVPLRSRQAARKTNGSAFASSERSTALPQKPAG